MRKFLSLFMLVIFLLSVSGCGKKVEEKSTEQNEVVAEEEKPAKKIPQSDKFFVADENFSNLQLQEFNKPVYDAYGIWERQKNNFAMRMPDLQPFDNGEKIVYLTFDDGPDNKNTPAVLDILLNEQVPGTFYVVGEMVENNPEVLKRIFEEGHAIGNHSYNHEYKDLYSDAWNFMEQIIKTDAAIMKVIGVRPLIIRAPGGTWGMFDENYPPIIKDMGYVEHDWNCLTQDATRSRPNAKTQLQNVINQLGDNPPKSVILLVHSNGGKEETVKALPSIIHLFKDMGYKFGVVTPMTPQPY